MILPYTIMREFEKKIVAKAEADADADGLEVLLEYLIPDFNAGVLILELYETGLIPQDKMEEYLEK